MENPFYTCYDCSDIPRRPFRPLSPTYNTHTRPVNPTYPSGPTQGKKPGPRVVQIPVQFVGSDRDDRPGSALKIQKVFRGFMVRKSVKRIRDVKAEVYSIEAKLSRSELVELIQRDERERLRINESLMALLFKLDSVRGIDSGVRECRKAVIRKAIALQERVDAIAAAANLEEDSGGEGKGIDVSSRLGDGADSDECVEIAEVVEGGSVEGVMEVEGGNEDGEIEIVDVSVDREVVKVCGDLDCDEKKNIDEENVKGGLDEKEKDDGDWVEVEGEGKGVEGKTEDESRCGRELVEKMIKENEKLMGLMMQLAERSEAQTRMLTALTHRVELLEKAVVCDRLRRRKKKAAAAARRED